MRGSLFAENRVTEFAMPGAHHVWATAARNSTLQTCSKKGVTTKSLTLEQLAKIAAPDEDCSDFDFKAALQLGNNLPEK